MNKNVNKQLKFNSFLFVLLLLFNVSVSFLSKILPVSNIANIYFVFLIIFYLLISFIITGFKLHKNIILMFMIILMFFGISIIRLGRISQTDDIFFNFLTFGLLSLLIASNKISSKKILEYIVYFTPIAIFMLITYENDLTYDTSVIDMGMSYALLPIPIAAITHFLFYKRKSIYFYFMYIVNFIILILLFAYGTRGIYLVAVFYLMLLLFRPRNKTITLTKKAFQILTFLILIILVIISIVFINQIVIYINDVMVYFDFNINVINKTYNLLINTGDITNSRIDLYTLAFEGIKNNIIIGNGIGSFHYFTGRNYPHNFILEILHDGGIVMMLVLLSSLAIATTSIANLKVNKNKYTLFLVLFTLSIPRLLVSASFWSNQIFWLLIGFILVSKNDKGGICSEL